MTIGFGTASALAGSPGAFADLDNDGVFGPNDVEIESMLADDGYFSTDEIAEGTVGIVVPSRLSVRTRALVLVATGDITVDANLSAGGQGAVIFLMSSGGSVKIADRVKVNTNSILQIVAAGNVDVGDRVALRARSRDFSMISVASANGDVNVGEGCNLGASTMLEMVTQEGTGGNVNVGQSTRLSSGDSMRVTAAEQVMCDGTNVRADALLLGSHGGTSEGRAAGGAGMASMRSSRIRSRRGSVHIFAEGDGGVIDLTDANVDAPSEAVVLDADVVVQ